MTCLGPITDARNHASPQGCPAGARCRPFPALRTVHHICGDWTFSSVLPFEPPSQGAGTVRGWGWSIPSQLASPPSAVVLQADS